MPKEVMDRRAADNEYLHQDFHGALSNALIYLEERFGPDAVRDYLRGFARGYYAPLRAELRERGLAAMAERLRQVYADEGAEIELELREDELVVRVPECPAMAHMRAHGHRVSRMWRETISAVHETICEGSAFDFDLVDFDELTGRSVQRFHRRGEEGSA